MAGELFVGVAIFSIIAIILLFGYLCSEYAKGSVRASESALAGKVVDVSTEQKNASEEPPEPPAMRQGNGERIPLQKRVQPIKSKPSTTTGRSDTAYHHPVIDTFDYSEPTRSRDTGSSGGGDYSSGDSGSGSFD